MTSGFSASHASLIAASSSNLQSLHAKKKARMAHSASSLLINVNDLLSLQGVEKQRVEFKKAWHSRKEGGTYWQVIHTICAFANDFYNDNGGYIIIGVEEKENWEDQGDDRQIILPPLGVPRKDLDRIQKEILGACRAYIKPEYFPILSPEIVESQPGENRKLVLVIWAMASDNRPHTCKESEKGENIYYIRRGTETKKASPGEIEQLLYLKNKIPFDDRRAIDNSGKRIYQIFQLLGNGSIEIWQYLPKVLFMLPSSAEFLSRVKNTRENLTETFLAPKPNFR